MSLRYALTGGFIKNAVLSALSIAVSRDGDNPKITQTDLLKGASLQLRGRLRMKVDVLYLKSIIEISFCVPMKMLLTGGYICIIVGSNIYRSLLFLTMMLCV